MKKIILIIVLISVIASCKIKEVFPRRVVGKVTNVTTSINIDGDQVTGTKERGTVTVKDSTGHSITLQIRFDQALTIMDEIQVGLESKNDLDIVMVWPEGEHYYQITIDNHR